MEENNPDTAKSALYLLLLKGSESKDERVGPEALRGAELRDRVHHTGIRRRRYFGVGGGHLDHYGGSGSAFGVPGAEPEGGKPRQAAAGAGDGRQFFV